MKSKTLKTTLMRCVIVGLLLTSRMLTGCASASRADVVSRQLYQAPVLRLQAGQPVETRDGTYTPQSDELWHSDARYRQIEAEVINATAALAAKQAEGTR